MHELWSFFSVRRSEYDRVKEGVWTDNWRALRFFSLISVIAFGAMTITSIFSSNIEQNMPIYLVYSFISLLFLFGSHVKINDIRRKALLVYAFFAVLLSFGIVTGAIISPEDLTVNYIVLMVVVPLLFTARACVMNGLVLVSMMIYILIARFTQDQLMFTYNLIDVIPYGILSMFTTAVMMRTKFQRLLYHAEIQSLEQIEKESKAKISNYENFITDMVRYASSEEEPDRVINQLVQYIGQKLNSDRAYIFEENDCGTFDNTYEWCKEGISQEKDHLQNVPYEGIIEIWYQQYKTSNNIIIDDIEEYRKTSQAIYDVLKPQGVYTLVTGPIVVEGKMIGFFGVDNPPREMLHDISELIGMMEFVVSFMIRLRNNARSLEYGALHDQLTSCKNRKALDFLYSKHYDANESLAVVMCDLNGLKEVNDKQGHDAGDRFILRTAEILKSIFGGEQVYRLGGDEFVAVLMNITRQALDEKIELAGIQLGTTASMGIAYQERMDTDFAGLLKIADAEMYRQKNNYYTATGKSRRKYM